MSETQAVVSQDVSLDTAKDFLAQYANVKSLLDAAVRQDNPGQWLRDRIDAVVETITFARECIQSGKGLTLPQSMGFGSDSFSAICAAIVNERAANGSLKSKAGKAGRAILKERQG
jgi:hypothetical protein